MDLLGGEPNAKNVAVLGLAFKPHSDDVRDSPALDVAVRLKGLGANVRATDPEAIANSRALHPQLDYRATLTDAVADADVVVMVTEWDEYRYLDPMELGALVAAVRTATRLPLVVKLSPNVTDVVARHEPSITRTEIYLCGPPPMVDAALALLETNSVPKDQVFYDKFTSPIFD